MKLNLNGQTLKQQINAELKYHIKDPSYDEILPNIFVGNYAFALNKKLLEENKITHILNCGNGLKNFYPKIFKYHIPWCYSRLYYIFKEIFFKSPPSYSLHELFQHFSLNIIKIKKK